MSNSKPSMSSHPQAPDATARNVGITFWNVGAIQRLALHYLAKTRLYQEKAAQARSDLQREQSESRSSELTQTFWYYVCLCSTALQIADRLNQMSQVIVEGGRGLLEDSPPESDPLLMDLFASHPLPAREQPAVLRMLAVAQIQLRRILLSTEEEMAITKEIRARIEHVQRRDLSLCHGRTPCQMCCEAFDQTTCAKGVELLQRRRVCERVIRQQLHSLPSASTLSSDNEAFMQATSIWIIALTAFWIWDRHCCGSLEQE